MASTAWFLATALGQWVFLIYLLAAYGLPASQGRWEAWNMAFPRGHVPGDVAGNSAVVFHLLPAVLVLGGGPLLLLPWLRARHPAIHRWLGRAYVAAACGGSLAGLYLVWIRGGTFGDRIQHVGITLDALFILAFAAQAVRHARARRHSLHRAWTLRLFLAASAVWFFRLALAGWIALHGRPVGFDPRTFSGPYLSVIAFAQTLFPLAFLEVYLAAQRRGGTAIRHAVAVSLALCALATGFGVWAATAHFWAPSMVRALRVS